MFHRFISRAVVSGAIARLTANLWRARPQREEAPQTRAINRRTSGGATFSCATLMALLACSANAIAAEISLNGHVFTLPDGFTIELVADSKLVPHPISADFDDLGRLYVTDSSGTNDPSKKQLEEKPHRIVRLEDTDGDGVFDKSTVWADKLMFPEGAMWHAGSLYVTAPPSIWKLTDTDDDGVADQRVEWFKGETLTGCANDLHGPFLGLDGWIYWCKGAFAEQHYRLERPRPGAVAWDSIPSDQRPNVISTTLGQAAHWKKVDEGRSRSRETSEIEPKIRTLTSSATKNSQPRSDSPTNGGYYWKTKASHVFRARPDGTGLEPILTGGMDNPVDIAFLPNSDYVVSNTFLVHPGSGKAGERDGLIHGIYGAMFGKEHAVLDGHPRTGELMPILAHMGAAAPCGLTRYENDVFGADYRDNLFCCQFNKHKVSRHVLKPKGATYESTDSDFVVSSNIDFHPTDVFEDADGSLVIVDTGGWYKLCCPTSQLHKPDILGAIYRVRKKDAPKIDDPRGLKIEGRSRRLPAPGTTTARARSSGQVSYAEVENLGELMEDARPIVRRRAYDEWYRRRLASSRTAGRPQAPLNHESKEPGPKVKLIPKPLEPSRKVQEFSLALARTLQPFDEVRLATFAGASGATAAAPLHVVSLTPPNRGLAIAQSCLTSDAAIVRRKAAESLGRIVSSNHSLDEKTCKQTGALLLKSSEKSADRAEQHAFSYALIEIADPVATAEGLKSDNSNVRRVALIALAQMPNGGLKPSDVTPLLTSTDDGLNETARWIVSRHPEWGGALAGFFEQQLSKVPLETHPVPGGRNLDEILEEQLTQFAQHPAIQELLAKSLVHQKLHIAARHMALRAIGNSKPKELSPNWADAIAKLIDTDANLKNVAIETARKLPPTKQPHAAYQQSLLAAANDKTLDPRWRLAAMATTGTALSALNDEQFAFVTGYLKPTDGITERAAAADVIATAKLSNEQLAALTKVIQDASPIELDRLLMPYERSTDEAVGLKLIASLKQAKVQSSLRMDLLRTRLAKYSEPVRHGVDELNALVNVDAATQKARIEELLPQMKTGDIRRGLQVFNSQKASCIACHKWAYLGGNVGPDLSKIGGIRTERDLLESILYPSLSFVRSYEPVTITTHSGKVFNGLIRAETATEITLMTGLNQETRIARSEIDEQLPGKISIMPAGLDKQLSVQELADLVTFLKSTK